MTTPQELIEKVTIGFQNKLNQMEAARQLGIAAANAVAPRVTALETSATNIIYMGGIDASDNNTGGFNSPLVSAAAVWDKVISGGDNRISIAGPVNWDHFSDTRIDGTVVFYKEPGSVNSRIKFVNSKNTPNRTGGWFARGDLSIDIQDVDVELDSDNSSFPVLWAYGSGSLRSWLSNVNVSQSENNTAFLAGNFFAAEQSLHLTGSTTVGMAGKLVHGVTAGADPRARPGFNTNLPTA